MITIGDDNDKYIYYDVDNTLVMWENYGEPGDAKIKIDGYYLRPHKTHIATLKAHKESGCIIIVWSQGGARWCRTVVDALELREHVDLCIGKPTTYFDDLEASVFMNWRRYFSE